MLSSCSTRKPRSGGGSIERTALSRSDTCPRLSHHRGHTGGGRRLGELGRQRPVDHQIGQAAERHHHLQEADVEIAKNYLAAEELDTLNRIVTIYLDFAELQALNRKPMYMKDWIAKLDDFLRASEREILTHTGSISHETAVEKARLEYEKFKRRLLEEPLPVEKHFIEAVKEVKKLEKKKPRNTRKTRRGK